MTKRDETNTLFARACAEQEQLFQGRFAKLTDASVVGKERQHQYPPGAGWSSDPVPAEQPTGEAVDAMPVVGEVHEIQQSLEEASPDAGRSSETE